MGTTDSLRLYLACPWQGEVGYKLTMILKKLRNNVKNPYSNEEEHVCMTSTWFGSAGYGYHNDQQPPFYNSHIE